MKSTTQQVYEEALRIAESEPKILSHFIEHPEDGTPLFPDILRIRRGERVATYRFIRVVTKPRGNEDV